MNDKKFLLVMIGLLTAGIIGSLKYKNVDVFPLTNPQSSRPFSDDWGPSNPQQPPDVPLAPQSPKTYKEAVDLAAKTNKPILLFFTQTNCAPCARMKKELGPAIAQSGDKLIYFEVSTETERELTSRFKITLTPSYLIINGQEVVMKRGSGYLSQQDFATWLGSPYQPETPQPPPQKPQVPPRQPQPPPSGGG